MELVKLNTLVLWEHSAYQGPWLPRCGSKALVQGFVGYLLGGARYAVEVVERGSSERAERVVSSDVIERSGDVSITVECSGDFFAIRLRPLEGGAANCGVPIVMAVCNLKLRWAE